MADTSLEKLERQYEQAKARLQSARARKAAKDRKLDARRKIILGGALIEKSSRDPQVTKLLMSLVAGLTRAQDRKAFDGWAPPAPETDGISDRESGDVGDVGAGVRSGAYTGAAPNTVAQETADTGSSGTQADVPGASAASEARLSRTGPPAEAGTAGRDDARPAEAGGSGGKEARRVPGPERRS